MSKLIPWHYCTPRLHRSFPLADELFREFFPTSEASKVWKPRVDVKETAEAYVIQAEVPGLDSKAIEITIKDKTLTLEGEKTQEEQQEGDRFHTVERSYGSFKRVFRFPEPVDAESVTARSEHGLLTVEIKKVPEIQPKRIEIQKGE